jgi:hypothetical protein
VYLWADIDDAASEFGGPGGRRCLRRIGAVVADAATPADADEAEPE